jgi:hypothetical protein
LSEPIPRRYAVMLGTRTACILDVTRIKDKIIWLSRNKNSYQDNNLRCIMWENNVHEEGSDTASYTGITFRIKHAVR